MRLDQANLSWLLRTLVLSAVLASQSVVAEINARIKWSSSIAALPSTDILRESADSYLTDHRVDFRLLFKESMGPLFIEVDPVLTYLTGDAESIRNQTGVPLEQLPGSDTYHYFNFSREFHSLDDSRLVGRLDRLNLRFQMPSWSVGVGRQALSWGSGIAFQPLDLFSPFSPITIDREFKPGVDSILFEALIGTNSEIQVLGIARQKENEVREDSHTAALKWHLDAVGLSFDLIVAEHRSESFYAFSSAIPVGGSLLRFDVSQMCGEVCVSSGLINVDHTFAIGPALLYAFAELYHNGHGIEKSTSELSTDLLDRFARGEVFTLMSNYLATGANITWHPLWSQSMVALRNLEDNSWLVQTTLTFDPNDASRVNFGVAKPFGERDTEFGLKSFEDKFTTSGHTSWYFAASYYF